MREVHGAVVAPGTVVAAKEAVQVATEAGERHSEVLEMKAVQVGKEVEVTAMRRAGGKRGDVQRRSHRRASAVDGGCGRMVRTKR